MKHKKLLRPKQLKKHNVNNIVSQELVWLAPYLFAIDDLIPLSKISNIKYYTNRKNCKSHHKAIIHRSGNNKSFSIILRTDKKQGKRSRPFRYEQEDLLFNLAHEISHIAHWEHDEAHFLLMSRIFKRFAHVLTEIGFERNEVSS